LFNQKNYNMQLANFLSNQDDNRIFIFQTEVPMSDRQLDYIKTKLNNDFFPSWVSHTKQIKPELLILNRHFIIVSTCESDISGCSIDSLMKEIKLIESEVSINLLNRLTIGYFKLRKRSMSIVDEINNLTLHFLSYQEFIKKFSNKKHNNIYVFNNSILKSTDIWIQPLDIWLG
tara:strand:- start:404 stop:925 length:522 start_codon:yes stop_codon:yes gene_type:complete